MRPQMRAGILLRIGECDDDPAGTDRSFRETELTAIGEGLRHEQAPASDPQRLFTPGSAALVGHEREVVGRLAVDFRPGVAAPRRKPHVTLG